MAEIGRIQSGLVPIRENRNTGDVSSRVVEPVRAINADKSGDSGRNVQKSLSDRIRTIRSEQFSDHQPSPRDQAEDFINDLLSNLITNATDNRRLRIEEDEASGLFVYQFVDKTSGEVVRQFPAEEILKLITRIRKAEGIVLDESI